MTTGNISITLVLVIITGCISVMSFKRELWMDNLIGYPYRETKNIEKYRWLTSGYVHGDFNHLLINMFVLFQFGTLLEQLFTYAHGVTVGRILFIVFYQLNIIIPSYVNYLKQKKNIAYKCLGASGATTGLVFASCLYDPWQMFIWPPVPAIIFAVLYVFYSIWAESKRDDNIGHLVHVVGGVVGIVLSLGLIPGLYEHFINNLLSFDL